MSPKRILVTSARMPFALEMIRKLAIAGHEVWASDTFGAAPGLHSRYLAGRFLTPSPRFETLDFLQRIEDAVSDHRIELVVPTFEEGYYMARHGARFRARTDLFVPSFETVARLHDKTRFVELAANLGLSVPRTRVARSPEELDAAIASTPRYFARPAYSRGGARLVTNHGPLAGAVDPRNAQPTARHPWLVQAFVEGEEVCSYSIAHHGRVVAHVSYVHPKTIEHAGGIVFESIVEPATLDATRRIVAATGYHGQIALDFKRTDDGLVVLECNPRATPGVSVMPNGLFEEALLRPSLDHCQVAPAGRRRKTTPALLRDMALNWREIASDVRELLSADPFVYAARGDWKPLLWAFLSYGRVIAYRRRRGRLRGRTDLMAAYFHDLAWDGDPVPCRPEELTAEAPIPGAAHPASGSG